MRAGSPLAHVTDVERSHGERYVCKIAQRECLVVNQRWTHRPVQARQQHPDCHQVWRWCSVSWVPPGVRHVVRACRQFLEDEGIDATDGPRARLI